MGTTFLYRNHNEHVVKDGLHVLQGSVIFNYTCRTVESKTFLVLMTLFIVFCKDRQNTQSATVF